ncbi:hypothetical protein SI65_00084 [Aspergillus cristatus]|uniref:GXWXG domain-containing protein n=1 Tax=Aspergillus cristatus TaxID=573508 RepID=A0A1E3BQ34_ASPCR|nr:hypothetical protein SI65_00084 [Aspergillus cristatus]
MTIPFPILPLDYHRSRSIGRFTPSRKFLAFTTTAASKKIDPAQLAAVFDQLLPVAPETLTAGSGEWRGIALNTGHKFMEQLESLHWRGAVFRSTEDVEPVAIDKADGEKATTDFGGACLRRMEYKNLISTAMIFDDLPAITYFRAVNDRMIAGVMESKDFGSEGAFYFYLVR